MEHVIIPNVKTNSPTTGRGRPDKLEFSISGQLCGGDEHCAGRRILENACYALNSSKGYRGMDLNCIITLIKVQLEALNDYLGINRSSRAKQTMRVEDAEEIVNIVRKENKIALEEGEAPLNREEVFQLIADLMLENLYANKTTSKHFFGITVSEAKTQSFQDLDPVIKKKLKKILTDSYSQLLAAELALNA